MRAVVIEIHKNYCIAVTPDGKFVKQNIEQGELEIGDEITIEAGHLAPSREWVKTLAIAFTAVLVIGFGSWGLFRVFGWYSPEGTRSQVADAVMEEDKEVAMELAAEEEAVGEPVEEAVEEAAPEEAAMAAEQAEDFAVELEKVEDVPSGPGEVDADFYLDLSVMGTPIEVVAGNLLFLYWIADSEEGLEIFLTIEELDPELSFTGYIELILLDAGGAVMGSRSFDFEEFARGDRQQEIIPIPHNEGTMNILINGIFE